MSDLIAIGSTSGKPCSAPDGSKQSFDPARGNLVIFIDPLECDGDARDTEISIPQRRSYSGSPVGVKDPIALQCIASYFEANGYKTRVLLRGLAGNAKILRIIEESRPELCAVCIALHSTYLVPSTVELAERIKVLAPGVPIIVGGYHPTGDSDIVMEAAIDYAVIQEGEESCLELVNALRRGEGHDFICNIRGIAFLDGSGHKIVTPARSRLDYSSLPWPKREKDILLLCQPGPLSYPAEGHVAQIAYSRGCPYSCTFCASAEMWEQRVKYRAPDDVASEMLHLITEFGVNNFFFCDLSFNGNERKLIELCAAVKEMKETAGCEFGSHVMCTSTKINEVVLQKMKESNFWKIDYGLEDVLEGTISKIKPFQKLEKIRNTLAITNRNGILMRGLMMIGYPWETEETVQLREQLIDLYPVDQLRLCFYTPFKGTEMYEQVKDRIIVGMEGMTTDQPAIRCDGIDSDALKKSVPRILKKFYNSENYIATISEKCALFPELSGSYYHFYNYLYRKHLLTEKSLSHFMEVTRAKATASVCV